LTSLRKKQRFSERLIDSPRFGKKVMKRIGEVTLWMEAFRFIYNPDMKKWGKSATRVLKPLSGKEKRVLESKLGLLRRQESPPASATFRISVIL
jgi:hypothetical protein